MFVIFKTSIKDFAFNNLPIFYDNKHVKISFDFPLIKYDFWQFLRNKFIIKTPLNLSIYYLYLKNEKDKHFMYVADFAFNNHLFPQKIM